VLFADDSTVARKQVEKTLDALGVKHIAAINGRKAWEELQRIAARCEAIHELAKMEVSLILTDVEMPEMDGYVLTKNVKSDPRFSGIPVIMYS
jgi:two-component system chemotaxis response regulator CheV